MVTREVELFDFTLEEMRQFRNKSGIYAIIHNNQVLYVGQSKNLGERLQTHRRENALESTISKIIHEVEKSGKCGNYSKTIAMYDYINKHRKEIQFAILLETAELNKWEQHYIELFLPKYNYKGVDVPY